MELVTLAHRTQGLILATGNPKRVKQISDVAKPDIRFVNRNPGSGTRLWLDAELTKLKVSTDQINGYEHGVNTHSDSASAIQSGKADAALGLQAAAYQHGLDFLPLFEERYDLVLPRENIKTLVPLFDYLQTSNFRRELSELTGYSSTHSGEQISLL